MRKNKKVVAILSLTILTIAVLGGQIFVERRYQEKLHAYKFQLEAAVTSLNKLEQNIAQAYDEGNQSFLKKDLTEKDLLKYQTALENTAVKPQKLKETDTAELEKQYDTEHKQVTVQLQALQKKLVIQKNVNSLFQLEGINGSELSENVPISDDLTYDKLKTVKSGLNFQGNDEWERAINSLLLSADKQLGNLNNAEKAVRALYDHDTVRKDITRADYEKACLLASKVQNEEKQSELLKRLNLVNDELDSRDNQNHEAEDKLGGIEKPIALQATRH